MRGIKFRMPIYNSAGRFCQWHYWGFIREPWGKVFVGIPIDPETAHKLSQQYTGLKDKNGKEIYEGDIIISMYTGNHPALIECDAPNGGYNIRERNGDYVEIDSNTILKIIGNIYENSGLLEAK